MKKSLSVILTLSIIFGLLTMLPTNVASLSDVPSDAVEYNGHYYKAFDVDVTWNEAKLYCESLGGHLVTITSQGEQSTIDSLLAECRRNAYWIGGYFDNNSWKWVTNESFTYTHWAFRLPDNFTGNEYYLSVYRIANPKAQSKPGEWNDLSFDGSCNNESFFGKNNIGLICEWDIASSSLSDVPSDAIEFNGHYYKLFNDGYDWNGAKAYCESVGGHLLTITSSDEQAFINGLVANAEKNS